MGLHVTWTEITLKEAFKVWKTHAVFAYNERQEVEWQLNIQENSCICELTQAVKDGCVIFVENKR